MRTLTHQSTHSEKKRLALPNRPIFRSIRMRIMTATALLIIALIATVIWLWASNESTFYREQKRLQAKSFATAISQSLQIELIEQNWSNMRTRMELLLQDNEDFVYAMVIDQRSQNQIVSAAPPELTQQYVPPFVKLAITQAGLQSATLPRITETFLLQDVRFENKLRARRGERIIDVIADIPDVNDRTQTVGFLRVGFTLRQLDSAITTAISKALAVGAVSLGLGLLGAYVLAHHLSEPVLKLRSSAAKIAAGDLYHRAEIDLADELGALAISFNEMSTSLQASFGRLQKTLDSFERFVPSKFLHAIAPRGIENIKVGEFSTRTIAILFSDIRGYTSLSENMSPQETFEFLNSYLDCMGRVIDRHGGFIDKYIGDAIMALFDEDYADGAIRAAIAMLESLAQFNQQRYEQGLAPIEVGIGIHWGEVVMGTVGFTSRIESTVIGDAVNLASRVEGLTKNYRCNILVTDAVVAALRYPEQVRLRLVDQAVRVKGKETTIAVYELLL